MVTYRPDNIFFCKLLHIAVPLKLKTRIFYAYYKDNKFVILHYFVKKTKKTPKTELEQTKRNLKDFLERNE